MNGTISVFLQNGGAGVWLALPAGRNDFQNALREIKAANPNDINIVQYKTVVAALPIEMLMNADLDHVNYLAARLAEFDPFQLETLEAVGESPYNLNSIAKMIDFTCNTDYYVLTPGIHNAEDLGRHCLFKSGQIQMPEEWKSAIDPETLGKRIAEVEKGAFTSHGYLNLSGDKWKEQYSVGEIPARYKISAW